MDLVRSRVPCTICPAIPTRDRSAAAQIRLNRIELIGAVSGWTAPDLCGGLERSFATVRAPARFAGGARRPRNRRGGERLSILVSGQPADRLLRGWEAQK